MSDLKKLMTQINKTMGDDTIQMLSDSDITVKSYPSGSLTLDLALGLGGIPNGRLIEVYGPFASGKTTIAMLHGAEVQRAGEGKVAFIDAEHSFNKKLAIQYGLDINNLIYVNPKNAENAIDIADALVRSGEVRLIIIDSVSALTPSKIMESSIEQQTMGLLARFMSTVCQKLNGPAYENECTVLFINQVREKIGVMYGNPETTSGGRALPFYSSVRLHVRAGEQLKNRDEVYGHLVKVKVTKNKVGTPYKEATFPLIYGEGVDKVDEISQLSIFAGIIRQAGAWFRYEDEQGEIVKRNDREMKFQGRNAFVEYMREDPGFMKELEARLRGVEIEAPDADTTTLDEYDKEIEALEQ